MAILVVLQFKKKWTQLTTTYYSLCYSFPTLFGCFQACNNNISEFKSMNIGPPQGSFLGPRPFSVYASNFFIYIKYVSRLVIPVAKVVRNLGLRKYYRINHKTKSS